MTENQASLPSVATLGPAGTFSDRATRLYLERRGEERPIRYFDSIRGALGAIGGECEIGILPVENLSEGFLSPILDHLATSDLVIVGEILLPIRFCFVGTGRAPGDVGRVFVQFVARGQCAEFLDSLPDAYIVTTESNMESLVRMRSAEGECGAIVPAGTFPRAEFPIVVENVQDRENNRTRFLVLSSDRDKADHVGDGPVKTSVIEMGHDDRPGFLVDVLSPFSMRGINLTSVVSRPTGKSMGKYHFFLDFDGDLEDGKVTTALDEIRAVTGVKVLGSYPRAEVVPEG